MRKLVKFVVAVSCMAVVLVGMVGVAFASGPNYATSTEWWTQLGYTGYIQIRASYNDTVLGGHVGQGKMWYTNTQNNGPYYTESAGWPMDTYTYTKTAQVYDLLDPFAPQAVFHKQFFLFP